MTNRSELNNKDRFHNCITNKLTQGLHFEELSSENIEILIEEEVALNERKANAELVVFLVVLIGELGGFIIFCALIGR